MIYAIQFVNNTNALYKILFVLYIVVYVCSSYCLILLQELCRVILCHSLCDCSHLSVEELRTIFKPILSVILVRCADAQRFVSVCLSVYLSLSVCLCLCTCLCVCLCIYLSVCMCLCLCVSASVYLSLYVSPCVCLSLCDCVFVCVSIYM